MKSLEKEPVALDIETAVDSAKVAEFVENQCQSFVRPAQDAVLTRENGVFQLTDSVTGIEVDVEATKERLNEAVRGGITAWRQSSRRRSPRGRASSSPRFRMCWEPSARTSAQATPRAPKI